MSDERPVVPRPPGRRKGGVLVWRYGHRRADDEQWHQTTGWRPENLRKPGLSPATVIDVGAGRGTPALYAAFPEAYLVMIDPLEEHEQPLLRHLERRDGRGEHLCVAAGAQDGLATIHVNRERTLGTSIRRRSGHTPEHLALLEARHVPVATLDGLLQEKAWKPPYGLKIDTEGFEREVVNGARALLEQTQFVIAEVSVRKRFEDSYTFAEFVELMQSLGFTLRDILDGQKSAVGGEVMYIDGFFRPDP